MLLTLDDQINAYHLSSDFTTRTVTHHDAGSLSTSCLGTWKTTDKLDSEHGESLVMVQQRESSIPSQPKIYRAVKRFCTQKSYPQTDNWPKISRGILCLGRAHVSDTIPVVRMLGWYSDNQFTYVAMEHYHHGNLRDFLLKSELQPESWCRAVIYQILGVLAELALVGLAHRNIKPSNILIASLLPIRVKLGDFHSAKWTTEESKMQTQVGTLPYVAPEMRGQVDSNNQNRLAESYDTKGDMWALGVVLHEMLTKMHPFREQGERLFSGRQYNRFLAGEEAVGLEALEGVSGSGVQFVGWLLNRDAEGRPTPGEALGAEWFAVQM